MTAARPLLSATMIVRDEEHHLPDCLASLEGVVDEVVVVDTGSSDATVAIAERAGARVLHHAWDGDFATARNRGLDVARGRWILYIDADERVRPVDRGSLAAQLETAEEVALRVLLRPRVGWTPFREFRLWRSDPRIRFRNVIHEEVVTAISEVGRADGRAIGSCALELDHIGYEGDQTHKHHRNLPLLQRRLAEDPTNIFNWRHLSSVLRGLGDPAEAEKALERAVAAARAERVPSVHGGVAYADLVALRHARGEDVAALLTEAEDRYPTNLMWYWLRSVVALDAGRCEEALADLDALVEVDPDEIAESGIAYDGRLVGAAAQSQRGLCLFRLGRYAEAAEAYAAAEALEPDELAHRVKRQLAEARRDR